MGLSFSWAERFLIRLTGFRPNFKGLLILCLIGHKPNYGMFAFIGFGIDPFDPWLHVLILEIKMYFYVCYVILNDLCIVLFNFKCNVIVRLEVVA